MTNEIHLDPVIWGLVKKHTRIFYKQHTYLPKKMSNGHWAFGDYYVAYKYDHMVDWFIDNPEDTEDLPLTPIIKISNKTYEKAKKRGWIIDNRLEKVIYDNAVSGRNPFTF